MKKIKVNVYALDTWCREKFFATRRHEKYYADCSLGPKQGRESLIEFWPTSRGWAFNTKGVLGGHGGFWNGTDVKGEEFPVEYFKRLCQAVWILKTHDTEFPEIEFTVGAKKLLGIQ